MPYPWRRQILSYNGSGTFVLNTTGLPYVTGTGISSTAANALNNDLATGLSTCLTKDGQTTPTANIPLGNFKITNLGAGTVASDAARLSQVQNSGTTTLIAITGTDTITGTVSPTLTAYTAGQVFSFVVAATNTGAVTLNISSLGATAVTRTGAVALVAGDMVTGQVALVEYDGTRFQLLNGNSFTNLKASGTLGVTGATTLSSTLGVTGATTLSSTLGVTGNTTLTGSATLNSTLAVTGGTFDAITISGSSTNSKGMLFQNSAASSKNYNIGSSGGGPSPAGSFFIYDDTASAARLVIDTSGNLGVGTGAPLSDFNITYTGNGTGNLRATQGELIIDLENTANDEGPGISFGHFSATAPEVVGRIATIRKAYPAMRMAFMFRAGGSGTADFAAADERISILSNGYVGIANIAPAYPLTLNGQPAANGYTAWTNYSDARLKENIVDFEPTGALSKIIAMRPVSFNYNELSGFSEEARARTVSGFIAQELQVICPEMVGAREIDAEEYLDTNTSNLNLYLVKAIQELKSIIDTQSARITALETL